MFFASCGNVLGIILNYFIGLFLYEKTKAKLTTSKIGKKSLQLGQRYGYYALFLSWLPVIGDPLTVVAGLLRLHFIYFLCIAASMRIVRYYFLTFVI
ncbi:MAG: DedA family protein [Sulfurimonas sp.]|nr:DedA family protein [Sulfurimonas sp.]